MQSYQRWKNNFYFCICAIYSGKVLYEKKSTTLEKSPKWFVFFEAVFSFSLTNSKDITGYILMTIYSLSFNCFDLIKT